MNQIVPPEAGATGDPALDEAGIGLLQMLQQQINQQITQEQVQSSAGNQRIINSILPDYTTFASTERLEQDQAQNQDNNNQNRNAEYIDVYPLWYQSLLDNFSIFYIIRVVYVIILHFILSLHNGWIDPRIRMYRNLRNTHEAMRNFNRRNQQAQNRQQNDDPNQPPGGAEQNANEDGWQLIQPIRVEDANGEEIKNDDVNGGGVAAAGTTEPTITQDLIDIDQDQIQETEHVQNISPEEQRMLNHQIHVLGPRFTSQDDIQEESKQQDMTNRVIVEGDERQQNQGVEQKEEEKNDGENSDIDDILFGDQIVQDDLM